MLGLGSALAAALLVQGLTRDADTATPPAETAIEDAAILDLAIVPMTALPDITAFAAVEDRPLFSATRRPPSARPAPPAEVEPEAIAAAEPEVAIDATPPPSVAPGQFSLAGVVDDDGRRFAVLRHAEENQPVKVVVGDVVHGWRVEAIELDAIVLSSQGVVDTIMLRDATPAAAAASHLESVRKAAKRATKRRGITAGDAAVDAYVRSLADGGEVEGLPPENDNVDAGLAADETDPSFDAEASEP
jgi:hypothetical protein